MKSRLPSVYDAINRVESEISLAQKDNFEKWPTLGKYCGVALVAFDSWEEEVNYVKTFLLRIELIGWIIILQNCENIVVSKFNKLLLYGESIVSISNNSQL